MKYRWDKKYLYWGVTAICVIVVSLLVFAAIFEFKGVLSVIGFIFRILSPVLYGFAIAYLLTPLVNKLDRIQMKTYFKNAKKPHKAQKAARAISVVASVLLLLGILIGLCMMLIPQLITNILGFYQNIESYFYNLEDWINGLVGQNSSFAEYANQFLGQVKQMIVGWMSADLVPQLQNILVNVTSTLWSVFSVFADLIIGMIIAIYFLYSKEKFAAQGKKVTYALFSHHNGDIIVKNARICAPCVWRFYYRKNYRFRYRRRSLFYCNDDISVSISAVNQCHHWCCQRHSVFWSVYRSNSKYFIDFIGRPSSGIVLFDFYSGITAD